jgi:hypothetical protein
MINIVEKNVPRVKIKKLEKGEIKKQSMKKEGETKLRNQPVTEI